MDPAIWERLVQRYAGRLPPGGVQPPRDAAKTDRAMPDREVELHRLAVQLYLLTTYE